MAAGEPVSSGGYMRADLRPCRLGLLREPRPSAGLISGCARRLAPVSAPVPGGQLGHAFRRADVRYRMASMYWAR